MESMVKPVQDPASDDKGKIIYLVRHGESTFNVEGMLHSYTVDEGPLTLRGREEAIAVAKFFKCIGFDGIVYSSPLLRARETASFITPRYVVDDRLREVGMGEWEKKRIRDIPNFNLYTRDPVSNPPPGGESVDSVAERMMSIMDEIKGNTVFVTHWLPIAAAIAKVLNMPLNNVYRITIGNASISALMRNENEWVVGFINLRPITMESIIGDKCM